MEELNKKIAYLVRLRYEYFLSNPTTSQDNFRRDLRRRAVQLTEEIPISIEAHQQNYFRGRILNICLDYDQICEDHLEKALKLKEDSELYWLELGKCKWKKPDTAKAYDCFRTAYNIIKTKLSDSSYDLLLYSKILGHLSAAIRCKLVRSKDQKFRDELIRESICLCEEAVDKSPAYGFGWYSLGNAYICRFFSLQTPNEHDLNLAIGAYQKALSIEEPRFISADLHVNLATAQKYIQDYSHSIDNLERALQIEPFFDEPKQRLQSLKSYLLRLGDAVKRKGRIPNKKFKDMISTLSRKDLGVYSESAKSSTRAEPLKWKHVDFSQLSIGENKEAVVCGKVLAIVTNEEQIPYSFVGADSDRNVIAITVYNCTSSFGYIIGDSFAVPEPVVVEVQDIKIDDTMLNFLIIRVTNPLRVLKNGKKFGHDIYAIANMQISVDDSPNL